MVFPQFTFTDLPWVRDMYHTRPWDTTRTLGIGRLILIDCYIGYTGNQNSRSLLEIESSPSWKRCVNISGENLADISNKWCSVRHETPRPLRWPCISRKVITCMQGSCLEVSRLGGAPRKDNDGVGVTRMIDQGKERRYCNTQWCQWRRSERKCIRHELCKVISASIWVRKW